MLRRTDNKLGAATAASGRDCDDHLWEPQSDPTDPDTADDDCSELVLRLDPDDLPDAHRVTLTLDDPSLIRVFDDGNNAILGPFTEVDAAGDPGDPVDTWETPLSDGLAAAPSDWTFHVEGVEPGVATLTLTYYTDTGLEIHSDTVTATVVDMDLDTDADNDGTNDDDADDPIEGSLPDGVFVGTNIDDDQAGVEI